MRIALFFGVILSFQVSYGADLPLYFNSGSNFVGTITRHKIQGPSGLETRFSRVGEAISLRMLTMAGKAVVLMAQRVGTENIAFSTFQINNDDSIFAEGKKALDEKNRQLDIATRNGNPFFHADVYQPRTYANLDLVVAAHRLTDPSPVPAPRVAMVTIILHPLDQDTVEGEAIVFNPGRTISENLWFDTRREIQPAAK